MTPNPERAAEAAAEAETEPKRATETEGPAGAASTLLSDVVQYVRHVVELAAAELQLAALSGVTMLMLVIMSAALIVMAWAFVAAVIAYALVMLGMPWPAAGLLLAAVHALGAYALWLGAVRLSRSLTLPELRRSVLSAEE